MLRITKTNSTAELYGMCVKFSQETRDMDKVSQVWLAQDGDKLAGCAAVKIINGKFDLAWLIVEDGYGGLKEKLYALALDYAIAKGADRLYINKKDWDFYEKKGFRELSDEEMPMEFRYCASCKKRNISCFPKSMVLQLARTAERDTPSPVSGSS